MARKYPVTLFPAIVASFIVLILMVIVTLSTPVWSTVYFLKLTLQSGSVTFGVLGSTGSSQQLGWVPSQWAGNGTTDARVDDERLANITYALILHPVAAILSIITVALSVIGLGTRKAAVMATLTSITNFLCVFIAFFVDIVLFSILKKRFLDPPEQERSTSYGPALWITLVAVIIAGLAVYSTSITAFGRSRYPRKWQTEESY